MRGEHEVEWLSLSDSALSAAVSHLGHGATAPREDSDMGQPDGVTLEGARAESDSWAERWGPDRSPRHASGGREWEGIAEGGKEEGSMMDGMKIVLSKEQQGGNEKSGLGG